MQYPYHPVQYPWYPVQYPPLPCGVPLMPCAVPLVTGGDNPHRGPLGAGKQARAPPLPVLHHCLVILGQAVTWVSQLRNNVCSWNFFFL